MLKNAQPIAVDYARGSIAVAHNGNLTNAEELRERLEARGSIFQSTSDTEVIVHLVALSSQRSPEDRVADALSRCRRVLAALPDAEVADRRARSDGPPPALPGPHAGQRRLGGRERALELRPDRRHFVRDVEPGEMLVIDEHGLRQRPPVPRRAAHFCIFEYVYFARPDSTLDGVSVYEARKNLGRAPGRASTASRPTS